MSQNNGKHYGGKTVEMVFYKTGPSQENIGLKFVLWEVGVEDSFEKKYDWGFANWNGESFDELPDLPADVTARVMRWANTIDPAILLNEDKIITPHG